MNLYNYCVDEFNLWFIQDGGGHHSNQKLHHTKKRFTKTKKGRKMPNLIPVHIMEEWIDELMEFVNRCVDKFEGTEYLEMIDEY